MDKLQSHIIRKILKYLDNENFINCLLTSKIFHVYTQKDYEYRVPTLNINNYKIKKLKLKDLGHTLIIGKRSTGKTTLLRDILYNYKCNINENFNNIMIKLFNYNSENIMFSDIIPNESIHENLTSELWENMKQVQEHKINSNNQIDKMNLIFEGALFTSTYNLLRDVWINSRSHYINVICIYQYILYIPNYVNFNTIFLFPDNLKSGQQRIYENYFRNFFATFGEAQDFINSFRETDENLFMVINNNSNSCKIEDRVFWYKAELHEIST